MRNHTECSKNTLWDHCVEKDIQLKKFSPNFFELERQPPNQFGHMLSLVKRRVK